MQRRSIPGSALGHRSWIGTVVHPRTRICSLSRSDDGSSTIAPDPAFGRPLLSLIALLLFFEFINLLVHPFLGEITHHSPILMLLCIAAIAGLLIPLHHRMEKLITNMLVSKNNRVRLEAARRTIEALEARSSEEASV